MSLIFAGIVPHPPLLVPNIGKEELKHLDTTVQALRKMEENLYLAKPHVIVVISPHGTIFHDSFAINAHTHFQASFDQFGDFTTKLEWQGSPDFAARIGHKANEEKAHVQLISEESLDHGVSVPLLYLTEHLRSAKILPISFSELSAKEHLQFGYLLKNACMETDKRVALIASGDLSHGLTTESPAGFSKVGKEFDEKIIQFLESHNSTGIINLDPTFIEEAAECGYRSLLILLGALQNMEYDFKHLSYDAPFGVGYLTGEFSFT